MAPSKRPKRAVVKTAKARLLEQQAKKNTASSLPSIQPTVPRREKRQRTKRVDMAMEIGSSPLAVRPQRVINFSEKTGGAGASTPVRAATPVRVATAPKAAHIANPFTTGAESERSRRFNAMWARDSLQANLEGATEPLTAAPVIEPVVETTQEGAPRVGDSDREEGVDYGLQIYCNFYVNKRLRATPWIGEKRTKLTLSLPDIEILYQPHIADAIKPLESYDEHIIAVVIRDIKKARGTSEKVVIEDFGVESNETILNICDQVLSKSSKGELRVTFEYKISVDTKKQRAELEKQDRAATTTPVERALGNDTQIASPKQGRSTRTTQMRANAQVRLDAEAHAGDVEARLRQRLLCREEGCYNEHAFCFEDPNDDGDVTGKKVHWAVKRPELAAWANQVTLGLATLQKPPYTIYQKILGQGSAVSGARQPEAKGKTTFTSMMDQMTSMTSKMMEMQASQQMMSLQSSMIEQQRAQTVRQEEVARRVAERAEEREEREHLAYQKRSQVQSTYRSAALPLVLPSSTPKRPQQRGNDVMSSSPMMVGRSIYQVVRDFFDWRLRSLQGEDEEVRSQWKLASIEAERALWTIEDLKAMEDSASDQSKEAEERGVPRAICRAFSSGIKQYLRYVKREDALTAAAAREFERQGGYNSGRV